MDNENADKLAEENRYLNNDNFVNVTLLAGEVVTNSKLRDKSILVKHRICNITVDRFIFLTVKLFLLLYKKYWSCFRQQTSMWIILNILTEQSSGSMVLSDMVPSWIRHHHHFNRPYVILCGTLEIINIFNKKIKTTKYDQLE
ncbi:hypothetical protein TNCV_4750951 [Trichonephila clavipes]|nr:hypothetical protein TNCV_4750951 [Trichonephila clavipes]